MRSHSRNGCRTWRMSGQEVRAELRAEVSRGCATHNGCGLQRCRQAARGKERLPVAKLEH